MTDFKNDRRGRARAGSPSPELMLRADAYEADLFARLLMLRSCLACPSGEIANGHPAKGSPLRPPRQFFCLCGMISRRAQYAVTGTPILLAASPHTPQHFPDHFRSEPS